jgi:hypothetical protein
MGGRWSNHFIIYIMSFLLSHPGGPIIGITVGITVFINTTSGERKLPEYAYSLDHDKFKYYAPLCS